MREREVERLLNRAVKGLRGLCLKWVSPGFDGVPDRIVQLPGGRIGFVEVKAPGERPRPLQLAGMKMLKELGFRAEVVDCPERIREVLDKILGDPGK